MCHANCELSSCSPRVIYQVDIVNSKPLEHKAASRASQCSAWPRRALAASRPLSVDLSCS